MNRVLLIGIAPEAVDTSDPDIPADTTQEKIAAGIGTTMADMRSRGCEGRFCSILPDDSAEAAIIECLSESWDCIVIGGGIRMPKANLAQFERVVNTIGRAAPGTPIAFNTEPGDSADAAHRVS